MTLCFSLLISNGINDAVGSPRHLLYNGNAPVTDGHLNSKIILSADQSFPHDSNYVCVTCAWVG